MSNTLAFYKKAGQSANMSPSVGLLVVRQYCDQYMHFNESFIIIQVRTTYKYLYATTACKGVGRNVCLWRLQKLTMLRHKHETTATGGERGVPTTSQLYHRICENLTGYPGHG